jgi:hypothetical protein
MVSCLKSAFLFTTVFNQKKGLRDPCLQTRREREK